MFTEHSLCGAFQKQKELFRRICRTRKLCSFIFSEALCQDHMIRSRQDWCGLSLGAGGHTCTHPGAPSKRTQKPSVQVTRLERKNFLSLQQHQTLPRIQLKRGLHLTTFCLQSNKCIAYAEKIVGCRCLSLSLNTVQCQDMEEVMRGAQHRLC